MKKILNNIYVLLLGLMISPTVVLADSGLDSTYDVTPSAIAVLGSCMSSIMSIIGELLNIQPGEPDYTVAHIVISIICIIIFYIFVCLYVFRLNKRKNVKTSKKLLISLIPTGIFSLICLLTKLQLAIYIVLLILFLIIIGLLAISLVITEIVKLNLQIKLVKELDKDFNEKELKNELFDIYKDVQLSWINSDLNKLKELISKDMYKDYKEKLDKLKKDNQKNIMDKIELKSFKIISIKVENNIEVIECDMTVSCIDYIIDKEEKVIKGEKEKYYIYVNNLVFNKDLKNKKIILISKRIDKISKSGT